MTIAVAFFDIIYYTVKLDCLSFLHWSASGFVKCNSNVHAVVFDCDWDLVVFARNSWNCLIDQNIALVIHACNICIKSKVGKLACIIAFTVDKNSVQHYKSNIVGLI